MNNTESLNYCTPRMVKKIVVFDTRFFKVGSRRYEIIAVDCFKEDAQITLKNIDTGERRTMAGKRIMEWFM